jgi:putative NADH-flavin reductase
MMRLTIFGATGATGAGLVEQALAAGHEITAVVRDPARLTNPSGERLTIVTADAMDPAAIAPAIAGSDAVLSVIGSPASGPTSVLTDSAHSIVKAMQTADVRRLVTITGSMISDAGDGPIMRYVGKPITRRMLRHTCADMLRAEEAIHASGLDWTIVRPPRLTDKAGTGTYRTAIERNVRRGFTISRADLAAYMLTLLNDPKTVHKHAFIAK